MRHHRALQSPLAANYLSDLRRLLCEMIQLEEAASKPAQIFINKLGENFAPRQAYFP